MRGSLPLCQLGVQDAHLAYRSGATDPVELLGAVLERVEQVNQLLNVFAHLDVEGASRAAGESRDRWAKRAERGDLDGVVFTVKDNITVEGLPCSWGTRVFRGFVPKRDEVPVARLRDAGAVILGKTNVSEFSNGRGIVSTPLFGTTRNPWRPDLTTGSSSGGAAAAVAAGIGSAALATDGGGSIRIPASHCGLVGLKPTLGRVARAYGLPVILGGREVVGPLARSTADISSIMSCIGRPHSEDPASWPFAAGSDHWSLNGELPPQRVYYMPAVGEAVVDGEIAAACRGVADHLATLGHSVEEGQAPFDVRKQASSAVITQAGMAWLMRGRNWQGEIDPYYAKLIQTGARVSGADYVQALADLHDVQAQLGSFFARYDLLVSPVLTAFAGPADSPVQGIYTGFTGFANTAGIPAISFPARISANGLPIGVQIAGRFGADRDLLQIAARFERDFQWRDQWPPL